MIKEYVQDKKCCLLYTSTSALDPQTTSSILALLKDINERFNITIVIITHQMSVVREICSHVAIVKGGEVAEQGTVEAVSYTHLDVYKRQIAYWAIKIQEGLMFNIIGGVSIVLVTACVIGCVVIGLALKRGQENVNKIVQIVQS